MTDPGGPHGYDGAKKLIRQEPTHSRRDDRAAAQSRGPCGQPPGSGKRPIALGANQRDVSEAPKKVWVASGYTGKGREWISEHMGWEVEVVGHPWRARGEWVPQGDLSDVSTVWFSSERMKLSPRGFRHLPRRWVVERTFAGIGRSRRMSKDYEYLTSSSENRVYLTLIRLLVRRLAGATETERRECPTASSRLSSLPGHALVENSRTSQGKR
jgi:putative transposase